MTIRGLDDPRNNDISDAVMNFKRVIVDGGNLMIPAVECVWSFCIGYFMGLGLSEDDAIRCAEIATSNGWY